MNFIARITRSVYTFCHYVALPGILVRLLWRSRYNTGYRLRWHERFGYIKRIPEGKTSIWIHAVSVGEAMAAIPLVKHLLKAYPQHEIVVTTTTPTGSALVTKHLKGSVTHVYAPYDVPSVVNRFLRRSRTRLCIIMETELWPNILHACRTRDIPILLANARMSEHSRHKYQLIRSLTRYMLSTYSMIAAQGLCDGERLISLGLDPKKLIISGNIKFDIPLPDGIVDAGQTLRQEWGTTHRPTLVVASTHEGEDAILLKAFANIRQSIKDALMVIVPRHPDRFQRVAKLCEDQGYQIVRRSERTKPSENTDIILGDTMGELRLIYAACDIAFVGGSLVSVGGHNLIEPAALGMPILTGPHLHNFAEISKLLRQAGAVQIVKDNKTIAKTAIAIFTNDELRQRMGKQALQVVANNRGALQKHLDWITTHFN